MLWFPLKFVQGLTLPQSVVVPGGAGTPTLELRRSGGSPRGAGSCGRRRGARLSRAA